MRQVTNSGPARPRQRNITVSERVAMDRKSGCAAAGASRASLDSLAGVVLSPGPKRVVAASPVADDQRLEFSPPAVAINE